MSGRAETGFEVGALRLLSAFLPTPHPVFGLPFAFLDEILARGIDRAEPARAEQLVGVVLEDPSHERPPEVVTGRTLVLEVVNGHPRKGTRVGVLGCRSAISPALDLGAASAAQRVHGSQQARSSNGRLAPVGAGAVRAPRSGACLFINPFNNW